MPSTLVPLSPKRIVKSAVELHARMPENRLSRWVRWVTNPLKSPLKRLLMLFDLHSPPTDRRVLEEVILRDLANRRDLHRVLFVGCETFTKHYSEVFRDKDYWTLDFDPEKVAFGATQHIVDSMTNVRDHFEENSLDLVICNGVFGWGLNEKVEIEAAFAGCFESLREDGIFLLGWNDLPTRRPISLEECEALGEFEEYQFAPLEAAEYRPAGHNRHVFNFYVKPSSCLAVHFASAFVELAAAI